MDLSGVQPPDPIASLDIVSFIGTAITLAFGFAGVVAMAYIIYGGYLWMTATGDPQKVKKAQDTLVYAVAGLVIVIISSLIVRFIANLLGVGDVVLNLHLP